ncbi:terpene synthase family protein [Streptomyces sp. PA5.6]|uniref:terpene synthase family protein n=1 Tax=Streptomyces sp. PA5.6 TaxID=3035651 RepID=UPI00390464BC
MPFVPDFTTPFRYRLNPHLAEVVPRARQWMRAFELVDDAHMVGYEMARIPELMAAAYPVASAEDLLLSCDAMGVMFAIEDEDSGSNPRHTVAGIAARCEGMVEVMGGAGPDTKDPVVAAFRDVWSRLTTGMSDAWVARHRGNWTAFLDNHHTWEPVVVAQSGMPTLSNYLQGRAISSGMYVLYDWSERFSADRAELPQPALDDPRLAALHLAVIYTIIAINDPHSYERELSRNDPVPNLLKVLAQHENLNVEESVERARKMLADAIEEYLDVEFDYLAHWRRQDLPAGQMSAVEQRLRDLRNWMASNCRWHYLTPRYAHVPRDPDRDRPDLPTARPEPTPAERSQ